MGKKINSQVGVLKSIWQYPVKSMRGKKLEHAHFTKGGIVGDRNFALIDQKSQKVASAKVPIKWARLLDLNAAYVEQPTSREAVSAVRITSDNGIDILSSSLDVDDVLSEYIGRSVKLSKTRPDQVSLERLDPLAIDESIVDIGNLMLADKFSDFADFHLLTSASLEYLTSLSPKVEFDEKRFRPNLVIDTDVIGSGFVENDWIGKTISIGSTVQIQITDPTPRCAIPTLSIHGLEKDRGVLDAIVSSNMLDVPFLDNKTKPCLGVYGFLIRGGVAHINDPICIE